MKNINGLSVAVITGLKAIIHFPLTSEINAFYLKVPSSEARLLFFNFCNLCFCYTMLVENA